MRIHGISSTGISVPQLTPDSLSVLDINPEPFACARKLWLALWVCCTYTTLASSDLLRRILKGHWSFDITYIICISVRRTPGACGLLRPLIPIGLELYQVRARLQLLRTPMECTNARPIWFDCSTTHAWVGSSVAITIDKSVWLNCACNYSWYISRMRGPLML